MFTFVFSMKPSLVVLLLTLTLSACVPASGPVPTYLPKEKRPDAPAEPVPAKGVMSAWVPERASRHGHLRKRRTLVAPAGDITGKTPATVVIDTTRIRRLRQLLATGIEPDLSEKSTFDRLFREPMQEVLPPMLVVGRETLLRINFDNDILDYTDRFYTNGIRLEVIAPGLRANPLSRLLLPYWGSGTNHYGLALVQNMYTPSTTKLGGILYGDRPYAAYLFVGAFKVSTDPIRKFRQTSEIDAGIIGPDSYGEWVQRSFHNAVPTNNEPLGWEYQVQNDIVLNYQVMLEKGIAATRHFDLALTASGSVGTLYTNATGGATLRAGWFNPAFGFPVSPTGSTLRSQLAGRFQASFFLRGSAKAVGYDATLQGGWLNHSSAYTFPAREISHAVFQASGGITLSYRGVRIEAEQFMLSPEFSHGWWHKWVHIALTFGL